MSITVAFVSARENSMFLPVIASLENQMSSGECIDVIFVNSRADSARCWKRNPDWPGKIQVNIIETPPKPTVWQGKHRVTSKDWWAMSNARNTALCLCATEYIVWLDDRSILMPGWLDGIKRAASQEYAVCGTYEKRHYMEVLNGSVFNPGTLDGSDDRAKQPGIRDCQGQFWGGTMGCPVAWALAVNGFEELVDGLGAEDYLFGMMLHNAGCETMFDPSIKIIQDRTPSFIGDPLKKTDKGISPNDKSHAALERFGSLKRAEHPWNLAEIRHRVLNGGEWPSVDAFPKTDWYDGQLISEFV